MGPELALECIQGNQVGIRKERKHYLGSYNIEPTDLGFWGV
jgi:hypothetical protein